MTDAELRDVALAELKQTSVGYINPYWKTPPAGSHWANALNYLAQIGQAPPPPAALGVDRATMLDTGGKILRDDTSAVSNPELGLWGNIEAASDSRHVWKTSGGDPRSRADGSSQGNSNYRSLTVLDGDNFSGERCELGRNERRYGENSTGQTTGTFALFREGEHKIIFWSMRFPSGSSPTGVDLSNSNWAVYMQLKQAEPYVANGPKDGGPAITVGIRSNKLYLSYFNMGDYWVTAAPVRDKWIRFALDAFYSKDKAKGWLQLYVDLDGDGDFLDANETSGKISGETLAYCSTAGDGLSVGDPIPGHLRLGVYHNSVIPGCTVHLDNVQVVG